MLSQTVTPRGRGFVSFGDGFTERVGVGGVNCGDYGEVVLKFLEVGFGGRARVVERVG